MYPALLGRAGCSVYSTSARPLGVVSRAPQIVTPSTTNENMKYTRVSGAQNSRTAVWTQLGDLRAEYLFRSRPKECRQNRGSLGCVLGPTRPERSHRSSSIADISVFAVTGPKMRRDCRYPYDVKYTPWPVDCVYLHVTSL